MEEDAAKALLQKEEAEEVVKVAAQSEAYEEMMELADNQYQWSSGMM